MLPPCRSQSLMHDELLIVKSDEAIPMLCVWPASVESLVAQGICILRIKQQSGQSTTRYECKPRNHI